MCADDDEVRETADLIRSVLVGIEDELPLACDAMGDPQGEWRVVGPAFIARTAGSIDSLAMLGDRGRPEDAATLTRSLWEHSVTFAWLAINPSDHLPLWHDDAQRRDAVKQAEASHYGITHLSDGEIAAGHAKARLVSFEQRARDADEYWSERIDGLNPSQEGGRKALLSFYGTYTALYRTASAVAHPQRESLDGYVSRDGVPGRPATVKRASSRGLALARLAVPLFSLAIVIAHRSLRWPSAQLAKQHEAALVRAASSIPTD